LKSLGFNFVLNFLVAFLSPCLFDFYPKDAALAAVAGDCPLFLLI